MKIDAQVEYTERDNLVVKLTIIKVWLQISRWLLVGLYSLLAVLTVYSSTEGIIKTGTMNVVTDSLVFLVFLILLTICAHLLFSRIYTGIVVGTVLYLIIITGTITTQYQPQNDNSDLLNTLYIFIPILAISIYTLKVAYKYKKIIQVLSNMKALSDP